MEPTPEQRAQVRALTAFGLTQDQICAYLGIGSKHTLEKHFRVELVEGPVKMNLQVYASMMKIATGGVPEATVKDMLTAQQFILERRGGQPWMPQALRQEITGANGGPIQQDVKYRVTPAEARRLMREAFGSVGPNAADSACGSSDSGAAADSSGA